MRAKLLAKRLLGREPFIRIRARVRSERLGTEYGSWFVALGHVPQGAVVYSCGIGEDVSFDRELVARRDAMVFAFDPTPRAAEYVTRWKESLGENLSFTPVAIGANDGKMTLYPPENPSWVSYSIVPSAKTAERAISVPMRSVSSLMRTYKHDIIDVLKLDIEGSEYDVIGDLLHSQAKVGQLLVEFHHRFRDIGVSRTRAVVAQLAGAGFLPYAVGESGHEVSFIHTSFL